MNDRSKVLWLGGPPDAIIVDLARVSLGPPSGDPACLEAWIAFELPPPKIQVDEGVWLFTVQELYTLPLVFAPAASPVQSMNWLSESVLQILGLALSKSSPVNYTITLALYMLRRAMYEPDSRATEIDFKRRTWTWILGCQLLEAVRAKESCYEEAV